MSQPSNLIRVAKNTIEIEKNAVDALTARVDENFVRACELILNCAGRTVVTGMGKSGHIARKISATLASTGTPAMFVHPGEASHGDLGMITEKDVVIVLSNSGTTEELVKLLPVLKRKGMPLIAFTGDISSPLGGNADVVLDTSVAEEACPLGLAPTSSTTAQLVFGDALAMGDQLILARALHGGETQQSRVIAERHGGLGLGDRLIGRSRKPAHHGDGPVDPVIDRLCRAFQR